MKPATSYIVAIALSSALFALSSTAKGQTNSSENIVELASQTDALSTLVEAVTAAGLVETLQGDGPFTVFAPTNEAFGKLPEGTVESLLKPENKDQLVRILTYHVVPGKVMSSDLTDGMQAETVQGSQITVKLGDEVQINNANVISTDIEASNGVVHIIDTVVMPPEKGTEESY